MYIVKVYFVIVCVLENKIFKCCIWILILKWYLIGFIVILELVFDICIDVEVCYILLNKWYVI